MTYSYRCPRCGHRQEAQHSMKAAPVVSCARKVAGARCGARMVREITGGVGYIMPGGTRRRAT